MPTNRVAVPKRATQGKTHTTTKIQVSNLLRDLVVLALGNDGEQRLAADVERLGERVQGRNAE